MAEPSDGIDMDMLTCFGRLVPSRLNDMDPTQERGVLLYTTGVKYRIGRTMPGEGNIQVHIHSSRTLTGLEHATIYWDGVHDRPRIHDHSRHGTYINEARVPEGSIIELKDGDKIWLGPPGVSLSGCLVFKSAFAREPFLNNYRFECFLGSGAFGAVYKVRRPRSPSQVFAVKVMRWHDHPSQGQTRSDIESELNALLLARNHPNVCPVVDSFVIEKRCSFLIVLPCFYGDLRAHYDNRRAPLAEAQTILKQSLEALRYIHDLGIVHRDIKPENMFLFQKSPHLIMVLGDFGVAYTVNQDKPWRNVEADYFRCGTAWYSAPELIDKKPLDNIFLIDAYSLGVSIFHMLVGQEMDPYNLSYASSCTEEVVWFSDRRLLWEKLDSVDFPDSALSALIGLTNPDPDMRWTVASALSCDWVQEASDMTGHVVQSQDTLEHIPGLPVSSPRKKAPLPPPRAPSARIAAAARAREEPTAATPAVQGGKGKKAKQVKFARKG